MQIEKLLAETNWLLRLDYRAFTGKEYSVFPHGSVASMPEEYLMSGKFTVGSWFAFVENEFWRKITAGHIELREFFPPFSELLSGCSCSLFGIRLTAVLGRGTDAVVFRTADGPAMKVVGGAKQAKLYREFSLLKKLFHPNVVCSYEFLQGHGYAGMLLAEVLPVIASVAGYRAGLREIHRQGYLHGDIRLANLGSNGAGQGILFDLGNSTPLDGRQAEFEMKCLDVYIKPDRKSAGRDDKMKAGCLCI